MKLEYMSLVKVCVVRDFLTGLHWGAANGSPRCEALGSSCVRAFVNHGPGGAGAARSRLFWGEVFLRPG